MTPPKISVFLNRNQFHPKFMEAWTVFEQLRMVRRSINLSMGEMVRLDTKNDPLHCLEHKEAIHLLERHERTHSIRLNELIDEIKMSMN